MSISSIGSNPSLNALMQREYHLSEKELQELEEAANDAGLTAEEKNEFIQCITSSRAKAHDLGHIQGKIGLAAQAIKKAYHRLPKGAQTFIKHYISIEAFFNVIEAYTGSVKETIEYGLRKIHCPHKVAELITETLMAFVF